MRDEVKYLDLYDAAFKEHPLDPEEPDDLENDDYHVHIGAKQNPCTFDSLDIRLHDDPAFRNFRLRLATFFNRELKLDALPNGRKLALQPQNKVC
jgi:hypothetical protein